MSEHKSLLKGFSTAEARWARLGPYYAMFPLDFALDVVSKYSCKGDYIIDPFAGRGSSIYASGILGRHGLGIEINPVGWLYGYVKTRPAAKEAVIQRLSDIYTCRDYYSKAGNYMSRFFKMCYCDEVLKFLLSARENLDWRNNIVDATLMSFLLVYLHGKLGEGLSNQMQMTKSMGANYSIEWWKKNRMIRPPEIDPYQHILNKIEWRYAMGTPKIANSYVILGDSTNELKKVTKKVKKERIKFSLLFTSPPYYNVTDYHADQWLRLWLLGGSESPISLQEKHKARFASKEAYYDLLDNVFGSCAALMSKHNTIYVRTDAREFTYQVTLSSLKKHFPRHKLKAIPRPFVKRTQTNLYGDYSAKPGEIDLILTV